MESILNITIFDNAVKGMKEAGISGVFVPWHDVLHDGPVPDGLSLEKLSEARARFITDRKKPQPRKNNTNVSVTRKNAI